MGVVRAGRGFSLVELLLVIGFIAGAILFAFLTYPKLQAKNRATTEAQHIVLFSAGIKNMYGTAHDYASLSNAALISAKVVPGDLQISGSTIVNVWGGDILFGPDPSSVIRYVVVYTGVPRSECVALATTVSQNFLKLTVEGTTIFDRTAAGSGRVDLDPALAAQSCKDGSVNTLVFTSS